MNLRKMNLLQQQLHELDYDSRYPCLRSGGREQAMMLQKRTLFPTLIVMTRSMPVSKLEFAISSSALGPLVFVLERLGRVVGVHVAEERQVGRQRLQAEVGVLEREHHLLEQHPVPARSQVQPVPAVPGEKWRKRI